MLENSLAMVPKVVWSMAVTLAVKLKVFMMAHQLGVHWVTTMFRVKIVLEVKNAVWLIVRRLVLGAVVGFEVGSMAECLDMQWDNPLNLTLRSIPLVLVTAQACPMAATAWNVSVSLRKGATQGLS
jgi:hypothetical protein